MQQNEISLTVEEVSEMYGYSVASIRRNFKRTSQSIQKRYGMDLFKYTGPDGETFYKISSTKDTFCVSFLMQIIQDMRCLWQRTERGAEERLPKELAELFTVASNPLIRF